MKINIDFSEINKENHVKQVYIITIIFQFQILSMIYWKYIMK